MILAILLLIITIITYKSYLILFHQFPKSNGIYGNFTYTLRFTVPDLVIITLVFEHKSKPKLDKVQNVKVVHRVYFHSFNSFLSVTNMTFDWIS